MKLLEVKHVTKKIKNGKDIQTILKDINLSFSTCEFVSIVGESGSGKSTLLQILGGLDSKYEGDVLLEGKPLKHMSKKDQSILHQQTIGFVFQSFYLLEHMSVVDNLLLASTKKDKELIDKLLKDLGILQLKKQKVSTLSGGEKQRVAIARALVNDPKIILADEPTGALDQKNHDLIVDILKNIARTGKLVLLVTHSKRIEQVSDRIIYLKDGKVVREQRKKPISYQENKKVLSKHQALSYFAKLKLAFTNVSRKKYRNFMVAFAASIGIMSILMMLHFNVGFKRMFLDQKNTMNIIEIQKENVFLEDEIQELCSMESILSCKVVYKELLSYQQILEWDDEKIVLEYLSTSLHGIKEQDIYGSLPKEGEVLINDTIPNSKDLLGKAVTLHLNIQGQSIELSRTVSGILQPQQKDLTNYFYQIYFPMDDLQKEIELSPNTLLFQTKEEDIENVKQILFDKGYSPSIEETFQKQMSEIFDIITYILIAVAMISLVVALLMIGVMVYINVMERKKEIALFRTLGYKNRDICQLFLFESIVLSFWTFLLSVFFTMSLLFFCNQVFPTTILKNDASIYFIGFFLSIFIYFLGTIFPMLSSLKIDPIEVLKGQ